MGQLSGLSEFTFLRRFVELAHDIVQSLDNQDFICLFFVMSVRPLTEIGYKVVQ
jgi:hypothetical protein